MNTEQVSVFSMLVVQGSAALYLLVHAVVVFHLSKAVPHLTQNDKVWLVGCWVLCADDVLHSWQVFEAPHVSQSKLYSIYTVYK